VIGQWLASGIRVIGVMPQGRWIDPQNSVEVAIGEAELLAALLKSDPVKSGLRSRWLEADERAEAAIVSVLEQAAADSTAAGETLAVTEPGVLREAAATAPAEGALIVSSSMPVRDLEWFASGRNDLAVFANRGANGIDGVTSTAVGIALTGVKTVLVIGDVAFLHDTNAMIGLTNRTLDLTIVVIDNDGGGIFSFLPQAELLAHDRYETLFGTPHGTDLAKLAAAHGIETAAWADRQNAVSNPQGVRLILAKTNRDENVRVHELLNAAIAQTVGPR
jgi:2-succinyl-5-enolpyruvyl-6-hydroxy-3-cyclohexene-1-carboxylate synthase